MYNYIDNALETYPQLKEYATSIAEYDNSTNPVDGVIYPNICTWIPGCVREEVEGVLDRKVNSLFLRMSPKGVHCPHPVHHDLSMGQNSMMLYLFEHGAGGTAFVSHVETGIAYAPERPDLVEILAADSADLHKWRMLGFATAKENRMVTFPAGLMHCALPLGGFGSNPSDARIVLTAFYD